MAALTEASARSIICFFTIPSNEVALGEQELNAIGKRRRLQEKLDKDKERRKPTPASKKRSAFRRKPKEAAQLPEKDLSEKSPRLSLDDVGEHEVKVTACRPCFLPQMLRPLAVKRCWRAVNTWCRYPTVYAGATHGPFPLACCLGPPSNPGSHATHLVAASAPVSTAYHALSAQHENTFSTLTRMYREQVLSLVPASRVSEGSASAKAEESAAPDAQPRRARNNRRIPVVDTQAPGQITVSVRAVGVRLATYLNSSAALARADLRFCSLSERDEVVTLTEASAREIEACLEADVVHGKVWYDVCRRTCHQRKTRVAS